MFQKQTGLTENILTHKVIAGNQLVCHVVTGSSRKTSKHYFHQHKVHIDPAIRRNYSNDLLEFLYVNKLYFGD